MFDPFFTTRMGQGGAGLGLNIAHTIVTSLMKGAVQDGNAPGGGTLFVLELPLRAAGALPQRRRAQAACLTCAATSEDACLPAWCFACRLVPDEAPLPCDSIAQFVASLASPHSSQWPNRSSSSR